MRERRISPLSRATLLETRTIESIRSRMESAQDLMGRYAELMFILNDLVKRTCKEQESEPTYDSH